MTDGTRVTPGDGSASLYRSALGIRVIEAGEGRARVSMSHADIVETFRREGIIHGGAVASLIDETAGVEVLSLQAAGELPWVVTATADLNVSYLEAARTDLVAEARVLRAGRSLVFLQVDVRDAAETLVATGRVTMFVRREE